MTTLKLYQGKGTHNKQKHIVPFAFKYDVPKKTSKTESFHTYVDKLIDQETGLWISSSMIENNSEVFNHITSLMDGNRLEEKEEGISVRSQIGRTLFFRPDKDTSGLLYNSHIHIQGNKQPGITCKGLGDRYFTIDSAQLALFVTGIGFLIITIDTSRLKTVNDVLIANNTFKAIKHAELYEVRYNTKKIYNNLDIKPYSPDTTVDNNHIVIKDVRGEKPTRCVISKKHIVVEDGSSIDYIDGKLYMEKRAIEGSKDTIDSTCLAMEYFTKTLVNYKQLIHGILKGIEVETFFNESMSKSISAIMSNKAHVYSTIALPKEQEDNRDVANMFFRLRKGYKESYIPTEDELSKNNEEVYHPMKNTYLGISREGAANLYFVTDPFMKAAYPKRIHNYFYLYIVALHQYYGLLHLAQKVSYLPLSLEESYSKKVQNQLQTIRNDCNFFYLKCIFQEVTHISHQAEYYQRLIKALGIKNMQQELNYEMEQIYEIVEAANTSISQKRVNRFGIIVSLMALVSVFSDIMGLWDRYSETNSHFIGFEWLNAGISFISLLFGLVVLFLVGNWIQNLRK